MQNDLFLLDTSAWIMVLKKNPLEVLKNRVDHLLLINAVAVIPLVKVELLGGTKNDTEFEKLGRRLDSLICCEINEEVWTKAARMAYNLRRTGLTVPYTDIIIAAAAIAYHATLIHIDKHFDMIAGVEELNTESFVGLMHV
jgi:predicted nucleic acid-binding protein